MDTIELLAEISVLRERLKNSVEVVRCKDCKHSDWYTKNGQHRCYCMENQVNGFAENDYCSRGERSE